MTVEGGTQESSAHACAEDPSDPCAHCCTRQWSWTTHCHPQSLCLYGKTAQSVRRFFRRNPSFGNRCAGRHWPLVIRRAATRHISPYFAPEFLQDPDRYVRRGAIARAPRHLILTLREDLDAGVRLAVARRLVGVELILMLNDPEAAVRRIVAERITTSMLPLMLNDGDRHVRRVIARRIDHSWLPMLAADPKPDVRAIVAGRLQSYALLAIRE
ncbi:MAG: hypothetical protein ACYDEV_08985 [Acidiferrobacter sp.]